jgi:hypothetical protein
VRIHELRRRERYPLIQRQVAQELPLNIAGRLSAATALRASRRTIMRIELRRSTQG